MQLSTAAVLQLMVGCTSKDIPMDGKPLHHLTKGFRNYPPAPKPATPGISFIFRRIRESYDKPKIPKDHVMEETLALSTFNQHAAAPSITWIGHSTYLLRLGNKFVLLDPFFSNLASPLPIGPERFVPPGIALEKLPPIDGVVISHNHYDHLDTKAIEALWCSWAIQTASTSIFFAGDTGYSPTVFKEIGQQFKAFDMAIVPIGAYDPANVMQPVHTNPEEAIQMANDVRADLIIPSHWGTITLTDEPPFEPVERYRAFAIENGIRDERASIMKIGETRTV